MHSDDCFACNLDVTDRVLASLPSFPSLRSTLLTSKSAYNVFNARPLYILSEVAYNHIGPALPQALRLVRSYDAQRRPKVVPSEEECVENSRITWEEAQLLAHVNKIVCGLEDLFSFREKDRTSRTSQLTSQESTRFQRAVYRIWLFSVLYGNARLTGCEQESHNFVQEPALAFLSAFSTAELREIERVARFLKRAVASAVENTENYELTIDSILTCGPPCILTAAARKAHMPDKAHLSSGRRGFLTDTLHQIWVERGIRPTWHFAGAGVLLDSVNGAKDRCARCNAVKGLSLFNPTNWDLLGAYVAPVETKLQQLGLIEASTSEPPPPRALVSYPEYMDAIYGMRDRDAYKSWQRDDWMCTRCVEEAVMVHLPAWWAQQ